MSKGINKAIILGYVGGDPKIFQTADGVQIANFGVATTKRFKDKQTDEMREKTEWHRVNCFGHLAGIVEKCVKKGTHVYIEGEIQTRKWQAKDGTDRYSTEIVANELQMLGRNVGQDQQGGVLGAQESSSRVVSRAQDNYNDEDDEIPF